MSCSRIEDNAFTINVTSFHNFDDDDDKYFQRERQEVCTANKCQPRKPNTMDQSEAGINMHFQQKDKGSSPKLEKLSQIPDKSRGDPVLPTECCHHREHKTKRKFICNFTSLTSNVSNQCLEMERSRCQAFWKLVDQRAELQSLMQSGEFEHISIPQIVATKKPKDVSIRCQNSDVLRAKNKALHDEERDRVNKRKQLMYELQKKSGQAVFTQQQEKLGKTTSIDKLSDDSAAATSFAQVFEEMNAFDVRCGNPVRTKQNPPSMSNSLYWATSFLSEWDGETSIVSSAGDELEEESGGEEEEEGDLGDEGQLDGGAAEILGESGESQ